MIYLLIIWLVGFVVSLFLLGMSVHKIFPKTYPWLMVLALSALWFYTYPYNFLTGKVPFVRG